MTNERELKTFSGWLFLGGLLLVAALASWGIVEAARGGRPLEVVGWVLVLALDCTCMAGLTVINPNEARVVTLAGVYKGTIRRAGYWWVNPFTTRRRMSLRIRNFESGRLKVNDRDGNPIEIASVVVWRIVDTFEAAFNVDDYEHFMHVQSEAALRILATWYSYDSHTDDQVSLRHSVGEVSDKLRQEIQDRLATAGIDVIEARISHLAYAPEIAGAMLRRQQASAVIAARQKIVEGAVGMVEMALEEIGRKQFVNLDEERKATMVSNLLVVLCSERGVEPVVNTGSLYQ
ncbi:membrane protein [Bryobacterales bacterium F-183]|nr:membrane protein [Bryobacterales bacterium F-183]